MRLPCSFCLVLTHGSLTQSWMLGMPLHWTLKTSSAASMRDTAHIFAADAIASFDTVDRGILDCASGWSGLPTWFGGCTFSYHARVKLRFELACLAQSSVDRCAAAANVTETDEEKILTQASRAPPIGTRSRSLVLGRHARPMQEAAVCAVLRTVTKQSLACHLMCLGPLGIGRPTAGSPRKGCSHWAPQQSATSCIEPCRCQLSMAFKHGLHFLPPSLCVSCRRSSSRWVTTVQA